MFTELLQLSYVERWVYQIKPGHTANGIETMKQENGGEKPELRIKEED